MGRPAILTHVISGHRRSSSYGSSSDKLYGPYHHHGGGGGGASSNVGVMGGGGGLGQYIPAPSIYTSYAHPHQPNPYAHLPLFPQVRFVLAPLVVLSVCEMSPYNDSTGMGVSSRTLVGLTQIWCVPPLCLGNR